MAIRVVSPISAQHLKKRLVENGWVQDLSTDKSLFSSSFILVFPPTCCKQMLSLGGKKEILQRDLWGYYVCGNCERCERCQELRLEKPIILADNGENDHKIMTARQVIRFFQAVDMVSKPRKEGSDELHQE